MIYPTSCWQEKLFLLRSSKEYGGKTGVPFGSMSTIPGNTCTVPELMDLSVALPEINDSQEKQEAGTLICRRPVVGVTHGLGRQQPLLSLWGWKRSKWVVEACVVRPPPGVRWGRGSAALGPLADSSSSMTFSEELSGQRLPSVCSRRQGDGQGKRWPHSLWELS